MNQHNYNTTAYYVDMLSPLSNAEKLDVIAKLIETMMPQEHSKSSSLLQLLTDFEGDWGGNLPVNEYVDSLRNQTLC